MKKTFLACFIVLIGSYVSAQVRSRAAEYAAASPAKSVYAELGGPGLASVNYDMRVTKRNDGLGFRVGFGGFSVDGASATFFPIGLNYLLSKDQRNYFELGAGVTFSSFKDNSRG